LWLRKHTSERFEVFLGWLGREHEIGVRRAAGLENVEPNGSDAPDLRDADLAMGEAGAERYLASGQSRRRSDGNRPLVRALKPMDLDVRPQGAGLHHAASNHVGVIR